MIVIRQKMIYRADLKANPEILYIFGDNLQRMGFGGQAKEMRHEPNAFGIATKRKITHGDSRDYFHDGEPDVIGILKNEFIYLYDRLTQVKLKERPTRSLHEFKYNAIVIPLDGIGTGLSRMPELAPKALEYINQQLEKLKEI